MNRRLILWLGVITAALGAPARAQEAAEPSPKVILIRPAGEPSPALRYRLLSERRDLIPGNAAIFYHRAIEALIGTTYRARIAVLEKRPVPGGEPESGEDPVSTWLGLPLEQFPKDEVRLYLSHRRTALYELELGTRRDSCDWEFQRRDEGYSLLLPDIQETRSLGYLLALRVRLDIAEGRIEDAIQGIRTGLTLARHVNENGFTIQSLVAAAIAQRFADILEEVVQAPGCPNLYWSLTALRRPFIDLASALEFEKNAFDQEFPLLRDIETEVWSLETARSFGEALEKTGGTLFQSWPRVQTSLGLPSVEDFRGHGAFLARIARSYPEAKRALLAEGIPPQRVEAMPTIQVVALHSYREYLVQRDEIFKWMSLPYPQSHAGLSEASSQVFEREASGIPFGSLLPGIQSVSAATVRLDRRFAVLRIVEGVRQYAASHDGALPPDLAALSESPAPDDPATGQPFAYKLEGETATLSPPPLASEVGTRYAVHYEFKLAR